MSKLEQALRASARKTLGLEDGEYFNSMVFTNQAREVRNLLTKLYRESDGDFEYVLFALNADE